MKIRNQLAIGIVCMILGIILALQYKLIQNNYLNGITPTRKQTELVNELITLKEEKITLNEEFENLQSTLSEIESDASKDNVIIRNLSITIKEYEILAGMTDVIGEGIVITIDNPSIDPNSGYEYNVVNYYDSILNLINELNAAGAEAISINDQRIISITEIRVAGDAINVNYIPQSIPLIVKAIGKKSALEGAIMNRYGIVGKLREYQLLIDVKTFDEIIIPRYHGNIEFQYVKTIGDN